MSRANPPGRGGVRKNKLANQKVLDDFESKHPTLFLLQLLSVYSTPKISKQKPAGEKAPRVFVLAFNG